MEWTSPPSKRRRRKLADDFVMSEIEVPDVEPEAAEQELSPEQQEIKRLRDMLAQERGHKDVDPIYEPETAVAAAPAGEVIRIHFLEDGLTALGKVFYRGEELEFVVGSAAHKDTFDRLGRSWLDLRKDEFGQVDRFGKVMFAGGSVAR